MRPAPASPAAVVGASHAGTATDPRPAAIASDALLDIL
jgi:hypothetical protein